MVIPKVGERIAHSAQYISSCDQSEAYASGMSSFLDHLSDFHTNLLTLQGVNVTFTGVAEDATTTKEP
jgi:hypothetical protein